MLGKLSCLVNPSHLHLLAFPQWLHPTAALFPVTRRDCQQNCPISPGLNITWVESGGGRGQVTKTWKYDGHMMGKYV